MGYPVFAHGGLKHSLDTPSPPQSSSQGSMRNAYRNGPLSYVHRSPLIRQQVAVNAIISLFSRGSPAAVARLVVAVVVDALKRRAFRALAHVG